MNEISQTNDNEAKKDKKKEIPHRAFNPPPNPNVGIWRYLPFINLISMLEYKGIFFPRAHLLGDPFEGSATHMDKLLERNFVDDLLKKIPTGSKLDETQLSKIFKASSEYRKLNVETQFVSCWHMNDDESAAMWNLYAKNNDSLAIKSTYAKLKDNLPDHVFIGTVSYIDYDQDAIPTGNILHNIMHKRKSFKHEQELRAVVWAGLKKHEHKKNADEWGLWIPVNLEILIDSIYVNPTSPDWTTKLIQTVLEPYGLKNKIPIIQSKLGENPIF